MSSAENNNALVHTTVATTVHIPVGCSFTMLSLILIFMPPPRAALYLLLPFPWESHGNGSSFRLIMEMGIVLMGMGIAYFIGEK